VTARTAASTATGTVPGTWLAMVLPPFDRTTGEVDAWGHRWDVRVPAAVERDWPWCRICGEQPAQPAAGDGLCGFCRGDVAEGRRSDPAGRAVDGQDEVGQDEEVVWVGRPGDYDLNGDEGRDVRGDDAGSVANLLVIAVCVVGIGVLLAVDHGPGVVSGLLWGVPVELAAIAGWLWRRVHGICRACGHRGSAGDPLTVWRRPRVHTRHLPNMRTSRRNSRRAALAMRDDASGGAS
jgi:hypothetical protein